MKVQGSKQRCMYFSALPSAERVNLYLHGVNNYRPSDYSLGDCFSEINPELFKELLGRLMASGDERTAFALILVLHGVTNSSYGYEVPKGFKVAAHCYQNSACLKLAYEIDESLKAN
ncbi:hypothetical protein [Solilutibacter pythonis]|uniref:hypothetical protein n=1 Tax=Solilutibacter pythonis TaxID=2483112 RepID=UPI0011C4965F|nr:hypothetical protein [Lysobacter pythonis]